MSFPGNSGFSFGQNQSTGTFGQQQPSNPTTTTTNASSGLFSSPAVPPGGHQFGSTSAAQPASGGFSFGQKTGSGSGLFGGAAPTSTNTAFGAFGGVSTPPAGYPFGAPKTTAASTQQSSGFSFASQTAATTQSQSSGLSLGSGTPAFGASFGSSATGSSLTFGQKTTAGPTKPPFGLGATATGVTPPSLFSTQTQPSAAKAPTQSAFGVTGSFNFGKPATQTPASCGISTGTASTFKLAGSLPGPAQTSQPTSVGFGFAASASSIAPQISQQPVTFGFSTPKTTVQPQQPSFKSTPPAFGPFGSNVPPSFGSNVPPTTKPTMQQPLTTGFSNFGSTKPSGFTGITLSTSASTQPSVTGLPSANQLNFPKTAAATSSASSLGFNFANKVANTAATTSTMPIPAARGPSFTVKTSSTTSTPGALGLSTTTASTTAPPVSTPSTSGFKLGGAGLNLFSGVTTAAAASTIPTKPLTTGPLAKGLSLGATTTSNAAASTATKTATATTAAATTTAVTMKYSDLEAKVNSWMSELEQQEKLFLTQATHVNAWNRLLIENSDKITALSAEFEDVELGQKRLNDELDYIKTQQNELEELLKPLEENTRQQMSSLSSSVHTHHADIERERTYNLAESIDSQLKNMAQDLREVVEHINSTSAPADASNPVYQIGKILSAHMDSLQWLDSNSTALGHKVQEMTRQVDQVKREHESKFRLAFN